MLDKSKPLIRERSAFLSFGEYFFEQDEEAYIHQTPFSLSVTSPQTFELNTQILNSEEGTLRAETNVDFWVKSKTFSDTWLVASLGLDRVKAHFDIGRQYFSGPRVHANLGLGFNCNRLFSEVQSRLTLNLFRSTSPTTTFNANIRLESDQGDLKLHHRHVCTSKDLHFGMLGTFDLEALRPSANVVMLGYKTSSYQLFARAFAADFSKAKFSLAGLFTRTIINYTKVQGEHKYGVEAQFTNGWAPKLVFSFSNQVKGKGLEYSCRLSSGLEGALSMRKELQPGTRVTCSVGGQFGRAREFRAGVRVEQQV